MTMRTETVAIQDRMALIIDAAMKGQHAMYLPTRSVIFVYMKRVPEQLTERWANVQNATEPTATKELRARTSAAKSQGSTDASGAEPETCDLNTNTSSWHSQSQAIIIIVMIIII